VSIGDTTAEYLDSFCKKASIDCATIQRVTMDPQVRMSQFLTKKVAVLTAYTTVDTPLIEEKLPAGALIAMDVTRYGLVVPGMAVVVKDSNVAAKRDALKSFLVAMDEAIATSRKDPAGATKILRQNWTASPSETVVQKQIELTMASIPKSAHAAGWIEEEAMKQAMELLQSNGKLDTTRPVAGYYTNELLK
jgi:NitT/TauT family transport system substrate-binding protein